MIGILSLILISAAQADTDSASDMNGSTMGRGRRSTGNRVNLTAADSDASMISGVCTVAESESNPIASPCVNLLLVLKDSDGNEILKTRTTLQGQFDFVAEQGKKYILASGSKFYDVISPKAAVQGGGKIRLVLQQK